MPELPANVRGFLDEHIFSATQLEVLLLLRSSTTPLPLAEIARRTAVPERSLLPWLHAFVARDLVEAGEEGYRIADTPASAVLPDVDVAWATRKTTLVRYIYAASGDPLARFADAFRFRGPADPRRPSSPTDPEP